MDLKRQLDNRKKFKTPAVKCKNPGADEIDERIEEFRAGETI